MNPEKVIENVCKAFSSPVSALNIKSQKDNLCYLRTAVIYSLYNELGLKHREIAALLGYNRSTVNDAYNRHHTYYRYAAQYRDCFNVIDIERPNIKVIKEVEKEYLSGVINNDHKKRRVVNKLVDSLIEDGLILVSSHTNSNRKDIYTAKLVSYEPTK